MTKKAAQTLRYFMEAHRPNGKKVMWGILKGIWKELKGIEGKKSPR